MRDGREKAAWQHTAHLLAKLHNSQCTRREAMVTADDCNPWIEKKAETPGEWSDLRGFWERMG